MINNNFYEWLELPVENFESDPAKLSSILEDYLKCCHESKDLSKQNRATIYKDEMRAAINDPVVWKQIYEDFIKSIEESIRDCLIMCADSDNRIESASISVIAAKYKVSESYVMNIAKNYGYKKELQYVECLPLAPPVNVTLKSIEPEFKNQLISVQKYLKELGFSDVFELIDKELETKTDFSAVKKDRVIETLSYIRKIWSRMSINSAKQQIKANMEKICAGMLTFLKKFDISDYMAFIRWYKVNELLTDLWTKCKNLGIQKLNDNYYNKAVDDIFAVLGNKKQARSILEAYCSERNISYSAVPQDTAALPKSDDDNEFKIIKLKFRNPSDSEVKTIEIKLPCSVDITIK